MRWRRAPAKLNLTLRVLGRRADGFHHLESLMAFVDEADWLGFAAGGPFELLVEGPGGEGIGPLEDNLVARAALALARRIPNLRLGRFRLIKRLPAAAGLGGGSSDAAACIRALAQANSLSLSDPRVTAAALETGSDVPVCLGGVARMVGGVGDRLGAPVRLPAIFAVLVNPRVALATRDIFADLGLEPGADFRLSVPDRSIRADARAVTLDDIRNGANDLESAARKRAPIIGDILESLRRMPMARVARMSGSGSTCFALFDNPAAAGGAHDRLLAQRPEWWIRTTTLH